MLQFIYKKGIWLIALIAVTIALVAYEPDWLWKIQSRNLFLYTSLFFKQQMVVVGGFLSYISMFFTQFLYHPWLGVLLLCGWWWILMEVTKRAFQISDSWNVLMLIPIALLLIANGELGYWIYTLKLHGYFFVATIGTTFAIANIWCFRLLPDKYFLRTTYIVLIGLIGYPLFGVYALFAILLMAIVTWRQKGSRAHAFINTFVAILVIVAIPLLCYRYIYDQTSMDKIYMTGLPIFAILEDYLIYYLPYILLGIIYLLFALTTGKLTENKWTEKKLITGLLQVAITIGLAIGVIHYWFKDENYHHELVMQHRIEQTDWEGVLQEAIQQDDEPTRAIVMMRNLALTRLGMATQMYNYPNGAKKIEAPFNTNSSLVCGKLIYYNYGMLNDCHHLCIEEGVEYGLYVETLQYLTRSALLSKEKQVTKKYLNLLKQTLYYDQWATEFEQMLNNSQLVKQSAETGPILHMLHPHNQLGIDDGDTESYMMRYLSILDSDDPYLQEQALLAALYVKKPNRFWKHFIKYIRIHSQEPIPQVFQEAAFLYANLEPHGDINKLPLKKEVKKNYRAFIKELQRYNNQDIQQVQQILNLQYGNTYFYDYYLRNNKND
ncbi:MAG: hypothetical protein IKZ62_01240 [Prevotella sp.]|nr:hypothetical protein [Prevotella sp.]